MYGDANAGLVGLAMTYAGSLIWGLQGFLQAFVDLETSLVSMERVLAYTDLVPEAPLLLEDDKRLEDSSWPTAGKIEFKDATLRVSEVFFFLREAASDTSTS